MVNLNEIEDAVDKNYDYHKKCFIIGIIFIVLGVLLITVSILIESTNPDLSRSLVPPTFAMFFIAFMVLFLSMIQDKISIPYSLKAVYYFDKTLKLIEEYEKTKDATTKEDKKNKSKLKKEIGKCLLKILKIKRSLLIDGSNYLYKDKDESDANFFKRAIYKINASIKNNEELSTNAVSFIRVYCQEKIRLMDSYYKDNIEKNREILINLDKEMQDEDDRIFTRYSSIKEKVVTPSIIKSFFLILAGITIIIVIFHILPGYQPVDFNSQVTWFFLAYAAATAIVLSYFKK